MSICETCEVQGPHEDDGTFYGAVRDLHRAVHTLGAVVMLSFVPVAGWVLDRLPGFKVDEAKVARWRRLHP